jgi:23S rRNA (uracil1939-C5)-methyltransferase
VADEFIVDLTLPIYGGDCMGRLPDGRTGFVPFTLPGETVRLRIIEEKPKFARAERIDILTSSKDRIMPRCRHFTQCGGCHVQHIAYPKQLELKHAVLIEQLERLGGVKNPPVQPIITSPQPWNYRNNVRFHLRLLINKYSLVSV